MANDRYYKVTTPSKIYKVKVVESSKTLFGSGRVWKLYGGSYSAIVPSYSYLCNCEDLNRIGEAIRIVYPNAKKIEVISR